MPVDRLRLAQQVCSRLPPLLAQRVRDWIYPFDLGQHEDRRLRVRSVTGSSIECSTSDYHGYRSAVQGYFEWRNVAICAAVCQEGDTVIEIGANVGTETVSFADIVGRSGRVHAVEPDPANYAELKRLLEVSDLPQVFLRRAAISAEAGTAVFERGADRQHSGMGRIVTGSVGDLKIEVDKLPLDSWLNNDGMARLRAIFIDVEGHEPAVLQGAESILATYKPIVVLEASPKLLAKSGWTLRTISDFFYKAGWLTYEITRFGIRSSVNLRSEQASNWLCVPQQQQELVERVRLFVRCAGWIPANCRLSPLRSNKCAGSTFCGGKI